MPDSNLKAVLVELTKQAQARSLPFLIVGGHAVILSGVPRFTRDIDLMITDAHREAWHDLILEHGYRLFHKVDAFEQFEHEKKPGIDLMLVNASTWEKLAPAAREVELAGGIKADIPAVLHLVAMKLNAARNPHRRPDATDLQDVFSLIQAGKIDPKSAEFREILDRYASRDDKKTLLRMFFEDE